MPALLSLSLLWELLKRSVDRLLDTDVFTYAASIAYYTIFSLPPILLLILYITTFFYEEASIKAAIFNEIGALAGTDSATQLANTVDRIGLFEDNGWASLVGGAALIFTATTVFVTLQNALNRIFGVIPKPEGTRAVLKLIKDRLLSFSFVMGIAFILLVSLSVNAFLTVFGEYLSSYISELSVVITTAIAIILPFLISVFLFGLIFRFLPDAKIPWRDIWPGAILTTLLFAVGKHLIGFYIGNSSTTDLYDAAGSIMVIMVWVYYASVIFLFGASFIYVYSKNLSRPVVPEDYAVKVKEKTIDVE